MRHDGQLKFLVYPADIPLPERDRPVNRVLHDGPAACSTAELLQALIGGPKSELVARTLLERYGDVAHLANAPIPEIATSIVGLGEKSVIRLKAALELGRRTLRSSDERVQIKTPADAATFLMPIMGSLEQEQVHTLMLDTRNRVIGAPMIYRGSLNSASMRIGEVFKEAIRHNAASIIVSHNHPSSDPSPSAEDIRVTKALYEAGKLLDCEVLDHVVIAGDRFVSLKERGLFGD
jgi:DNA repair protein RadC